MQRLLYCLILFVSLTGYGQGAAVSIGTRIENVKTEKHLNIPGTRLFIIPPPNFRIATTFIGLQKGKQAMMNVFDLVGGDYYTNAATFNKVEFLSRGIKVFDFREITINGFPAKYLSMQGDPATKTYGLVFGDTTFSTMIMAVYPASDETTGREIINSLNSIVYDKSKKVDPFETASFSLDDKGSKFKFFRSNANLYMYTPGGIDNTKNEDAPTFMVSQMPKDGGATLKSVVDAVLDKSRQYGMTNIETKYAVTKKINEVDGYETEVDAQVKDNKTHYYYLVVSKEDKAILIVATTKSDIDNNVREFKKLAYTLKFK